MISPLLLQNILPKGKLDDLFGSSTTAKGAIGKQHHFAKIFDRLVEQKQGGASAAKVFAEILAQLYGKITSPDVTAALNKSLKSLEGVSTEAVGKVTEQLGVSSKEAQKGVESVKGKVKGFLGN